MAFPQFLNLWPAAVAAAVAIPALLVLYFLKLRRQERPVPSTLLWKKAVQDLQVNSPFQRLRRNLLLLLQLLILAFLVAALSRPVMSVTRGAGDVNVILIDRSASMSATDMPGGRTRLEEAQRRAQELVDSMRRGSTAMVIAFDESAEIVQQWTSDTVGLRQAIDRIQPTDRPARLKMAYQLAEAQINFNPLTAADLDEALRTLPIPDVRLFSDGRAADADELSIQAKVYYEPIGTQGAKNVGIVALNAKRNYERPTEVQIFARLANAGAEPVRADVQLSVSPGLEGGRFQVVRIASTTLLPERWGDEQREAAEREHGLIARDSVEFTIELTTAAVVRVEQMSREGDALPADDVAHVVVPPPKRLEVLLVSEGNWYLEQIMQSLSLQRWETMTPAAYDAQVPAGYDLIIFDRHSPARLPGAGNFIYFDGIAEGLKLKPMRQGEDGPAVVVQNAGVLDWKRDHPILRHLSLQRLYAIEALRLDVPVESEVLMDGVAAPLIVLHREGRSTHLVVAFDLLQSNWPLRVSFPIFMNNALQFLAIGSEMDVRQSYSPGATPRVPRANLERVAGAGGSRGIRLHGPMGMRELAIPEAGDFALPPLDRVGVYSLEPAVPQFEQIAVNLLDANESLLVPSERAPGGLGETIAAGEGRKRLELWWWIVALVALPLLFVEWWVYTRRVHL
jgi:hypothetical protein